MSTKALDFGSYVAAAAAESELVVQPRMGMSDPARMRSGLCAVDAARATTAGTITLDSYTRVGDHEGAARAVADRRPLNGFPVVTYGPEVTAAVIEPVRANMPVQVRHGSAKPAAIFETMVAAGLSTSEGGPVSYCLPYGRTPLAESVASWRAATTQLAEDCQALGMRAHLETFGGCLLGQLCPPSLLVAMSVLEALFFSQHGVPSVSLSYAQQTNPLQDIEALSALRQLSADLLPAAVDRHIVLYTYMGVYPATEGGALNLLDDSAELAVRGGAQRLIVKTTAEAYRIPTIEQNIAALERAARTARHAVRDSALPWVDDVDCGPVLDEARALVDAVLNLSDDVGKALIQAFAAGVLDVPFCLHQDNHGRTQGCITADGRLAWARTGNMPLPRKPDRRTVDRVTSDRLLSMLRFTAERQDQIADQKIVEEKSCPTP